MSDTPQLEERQCAKCGATDTEPHHVSYVAFNHPVSGMGVDLSVSKHVQCCAEDGCPICSSDIQRAKDDGFDVSTNLREWLTNRPDDHQEMMFKRFGIETPGHETTGEEAPANGEPSND